MGRLGKAIEWGDQVDRSLRNGARENLGGLGRRLGDGLGGTNSIGTGGFCPANSFSADTTVATEDGDIAISDIEIGDDVLAYNEDTGQTDSYEVTDTISHIDPEIVLLTIDGETLETTTEHPFYTLSGEWVDAADLLPGDLIRNLDGSYGEVASMRIVERV
jgi:Pretoxin HINT domain